MVTGRAVGGNAQPTGRRFATRPGTEQSRGGNRHARINPTAAVHQCRPLDAFATDRSSVTEPASGTSTPAFQADRIRDAISATDIGSDTCVTTADRTLGVLSVPGGDEIGRDGETWLARTVNHRHDGCEHNPRLDFGSRGAAAQPLGRRAKMFLARNQPTR